MTVEIDGANNIIKTNTINEVTSANGITIDGLNIKDSKLVTANSVVEANITNGAVTSGKIASGVVPTLRPNAKPLVINSNMAIAQRNSGTVAQSDGSNEGYATVDRMNLVFGNSAGGTITTSRDNTAPTGFGQSMKFDVTSADGSVASNQIVYMKTTLEAQDIRNSGWNYTSSSSYLTLSFWVRSSKTGIYCAFLETLDASYMRSSEYTISSADTWEQKVLTFPGKTELVFNNDNGAGLNIGFTFAVGTDRDGTNNTWETTNYGTSNQVNFLDSTSNILYLTGIQLEVGEFSSTNLPPFQHESYGDNLLRCQRYYQLVQNWSGGVVNSSTAYINATFWKTMRTTPSVTTTGALNGNDIANNVNQSSGQVTLHGANENGFWGGVGNWSSLTTNNPFNSRFQNTNKLAFVSEL